MAPNSEARKKDVKNLKVRGIPTVYIDRDIGGDRIGVIKTDNRIAGEIAAKEMVKALKGMGTVAVLRMSKDVRSTTLREEGFIKVAKKAGLEVISDFYLGSSVGSARSQTKEILLKLLKIKGMAGLFTPNESTKRLATCTNTSTS